MGHFLEVARKVLSVIEAPLTPKEITSIGLKKGWLRSKGRTPWQTMKSKLSTDILRKKSDSVFMRTEQGKFGLRLWNREGVQEYIADRFQKAILDEDIVVFPATSLNKYIQGSGLLTTPIENGRTLVRECSSMSRRLAEKNFNVIQLITVFIIKYKSRYLTYKRAKRLPENRLHGFYSIAFGGHLNPNEIPALFDIFDPKNAGLFLNRELKEEIRFSKDKPISTIYKGLLYDNSQSVSSQHLGIVYDVILESDIYEIGERGFLIDPKFETIDEMMGRISDFENWSITLINYESKMQREYQ